MANTTDGFVYFDGGKIVTSASVRNSAGDLINQRANVGNPVTSLISNTDNTNAASSAVNLISVGGTSAGDPLTTYQIVGGAAWNQGLDTSASGSYKIAANSGLGANDTFIISTAGLVVIPMGDLNVQRANSGASVQLLCANSSNTASSHAAAQVYVAGSSAGDPYSLYTVNGVTNFSAGIDNSDSDKYKISNSTGIGTNDCISITTGGQVTFPQQSSFIAYPSSNATNATGDGTVYAIVGDQYTRVGTDYNNSTGIYTAPIDGWYTFAGSILLGSIAAGHTLGVCRITAGGRSYYGTGLNPFICKDSNSDVVLNVNLAKVYLTAGQTASFEVFVSGGTKTITVSGSSPPAMYAYFCGGLVH